jgi:two-component sensor histidine kinase
MARIRTHWFPSFWQIQFASWTVLYVLLIVAAFPHLREPAILSYNTVGCVLSFCASILLRPVCRMVYKRWFHSWVVLEVFAFALSMVAGTIVTFCCQLIVLGVENFRWSNWFLGGVQLSLVFFLWCSLYFSVKQWLQSVEERERLLRAESAAREALLNALRFQLNPHFLFNSLNAVSTFVLERKTEDAVRMIDQISQFLRASLASESLAKIPFAQEIAFVRQYLAIEQTRFGSRLQVGLHIAPESADALVPAMILQPLVENAVKHGIAQMVGDGWITVQSQVTERRIRILIRNSASLAPHENLQNSTGMGVGLKNVEQRLKTLYGADADFAITWPEEGVCQVRVEIPL